MATRRQKAPAPRDRLSIIHQAQVANLLKKQRDGKPLAARDLEFLEQQLGTKVVEPEDKPSRKGRGIMLTPSEFIRWASERGVKISRKSFYKTYFGGGARHPAPRSKDGRRVNAEETLELIKIVQADDHSDGSRILQERQQAEARVKNARASMAEIDLQAKMGMRPRIEVVKKVWGRAIENIFNELRAMESNLPKELVGRSESEIKELIIQHHDQARRHAAKELNYA